MQPLLNQNEATRYYYELLGTERSRRHKVVLLVWEILDWEMQQEEKQIYLWAYVKKGGSAHIVLGSPINEADSLYFKDDQDWVNHIEIVERVKLVCEEILNK